jgi:acetoin utilization deacetylase AcuC-like enzyme
MQIVYSPEYHIDIGTHVFPTSKYSLLAERVAASGLAQPFDFVEPAPASWDDLELVHTPEYLERLRAGNFGIEELAQLELPWSREVVDGFRLMTGGTILAARLALERKPGLASPEMSAQRDPVSHLVSSSIVAHLGGGLHHAFPDHGEGFCFFNDVAVAVRVLQRDGLAASASVVDLDVHHGNGTAFIFDGDPRVFTYSMHQEHNYPVLKPRGSLDVGLPDGIDDSAYVDRLRETLPLAFEQSPDVVFYLSGADPFDDDQLGGLSLSKAGLRERDRIVLQTAREHGVPVVICLAGGYARHLNDTVDIHYATIEEAARS